VDPIIREIIVQLVGFTIVFFILKTFAWKPILKILDDRRERITTGFEDIEKGKQDLETMKQEYANRLTRIEEEARDKIQEAVSEGKQIAQEMREEAREEANQALQKSKDNIALELAKAQLELRGQVIELSLAAAGHVLKQELNETKQKDLVSSFLEELQTETGK